MALIPDIRRLTKDDFPGQADWIGKLLLPLGKFMESLTLSMKHGLTFEDNLSSQVATITVGVGQVFPIKVKVTVPGSGAAVKGAWVVYGQELDPSTGARTALAAAPHIDWATDKDQFVINALVGLTADKKYELRIILTGG